jgi:hypothetical protein
MLVQVMDSSSTTTTFVTILKQRFLFTIMFLVEKIKHLNNCKSNKNQFQQLVFIKVRNSNGAFIERMGCNDSLSNHPQW